MQEQQTPDEANPPVEEQGQGKSPIGGTEIVEPGDTGETREVQVEDAGSEASVSPPEEDKGLTVPGGQSYEALRVKMNEQGVELNSYRKRYQELEEKSSSTAEELEAYKKWYDQYYPVMNELWQDASIRPRIEGGVKPRTITAEDAERIAEKKLQEFREQTQYERSVDTWLQSHPDVKGDLAKRIYTFLDKNDLNPTPEMLETAYVYCTKDRLKEIGAREKELHAQKVSNAAVGGGGSSTPGKPGNPIDDLFQTPVSDFYPGPKL
jgi:hypothetical protein